MPEFVWISKLVVFTASGVMIAIRAPHGRRSQGVAVRKSRKGGLEIALLALAVASFFVPLIWIVAPVMSFADYPMRPWALGVGTILLALSMCLFHLSHRALGTNWSITLEIREGHRLVTEGIYRSIRHPMYSALFLYSAGQCLALSNWVAGPSYFVAFGILYALRVGREEKMMIEEFGEEYRAYMERTRRLVPGIW